jgi:mono/diheme cytochrome c family protein/ketosteroid isomerase-like protein
MTESTDVIRLYLDDDKEPFKTARPPLRFQFSTLHLADGPHRLRVEAHNGLAGESIKEIPFHVRNGVAITIQGLEPGQEIAGQVGVIVNAYAGNTEIDFEPSRAETPAPIPTWAWLIFLAIAAWTMFYLLNPGGASEQVASAGVSANAGDRVYRDVCAKCHQETGLGAPGLGPLPLKDSDAVLDAEPLNLISFVAAGPLPEGGGAKASRTRARIRMPAFGPPRLEPMDFVAALNHIRSHWGNQAPPIEPQSKRGPAMIRAFDAELTKAFQSKDAGKIESLYASGDDVRLVRVGVDKIDVSTNAAVAKASRDWLESIQYLNSMTVLDAAYHVFEGGNMVYAHGHVRLNVVPMEGPPGRDFTGTFLRVYVNEPVTDESGNVSCDPKGTPLRRWRLAFDYATTPMPIGCEPGMPGADGASCPPNEVGRIDFVRIVEILERIGERAPKAQHGNFWELPYDDFVALKFPYPPVPNGEIRLINLDRTKGITGSDTNFVRAITDGKGVRVSVPGKDDVVVDIPKMPKGGKGLAPNDVGRIVAWLDAGFPKTVADPVRSTPEPAPAGMGNPRDPQTHTGMNGTPPPTPPPTPGMEPEVGTGGGTAPVAPAGAADWRTDDLDYAGVIAIFRSLAEKAPGSPHKVFWVDPSDKTKDRPYADFVKSEFALTSRDGKVVLMKPGDSANSNLVRALRGETLLVTLPNGKVEEWPLESVMPPGKKKPTDLQIELLARWIDHGCPEKRPAGK